MSKKLESQERMDNFIKVYLPEIQKIYEVKQFEHHFKICVNKKLSFDYYPKGRKVGTVINGRTSGKYRVLEPLSLLKELFALKAKI